MTNELGKDVLREVSRSFYLTLRLLPEPMRGAASLGYLLARTSDTIADSVAGESRMEGLEMFGKWVAGEEGAVVWPGGLLEAVGDPGERRLMERTHELINWLEGLPEREAELVREVVDIIVSGQRLDLERFGGADEDTPAVLSDDGMLEDYAWRVAGCVGAFWTKLGFLTLGGGFSGQPQARLLEWGIEYGKGLQLVNILRDLPRDLAMGRCYLPVEDVGDVDELMSAHGRWVEVAAQWVGAGFDYAAALEMRRLRAATVLPAMIARETLEPLRGVSWETLQTRVKVPRRRVYLALLRAILGGGGSRGGRTG